MAYSCRGIRFLCFFISVYGPYLSAAQSGVQQVKGIVGESLTFPVELLELLPHIDISWRHGHADPDRRIARIWNGKIVSVFEERFKTRLQLDNITNSLRINGLESEDGGFYLVQKFMSSSFVKKFQLSVYNLVPEPQVLQIHSGEVMANRSCTLLCFVGNASEVNVSWMRDGKPLHTTELEISQEMQGDNVTYTCVASNPASNKTITVTPSHYCDEKGDGAEPQRSHCFSIAGIVIAVMGVAAYLRREKTATEEEGRAERKESHLNARHSGSMKTGYKEELPERLMEHRAHKRKKPSSTARDSSEDRPERDDCSSKRVRRQRRESVSSEASECSGDSALESDCCMDNTLESDCSVDNALESDCSRDSALESDCSVDSALGSDCSVGSALESDCYVGSALESDCSVGSALESDCSVGSALESDCSVDSALGSDCSVGSALESDCYVGSALESDCSVDSALGSDCSVGSALESDCYVGSALESDCSVGSALESDCSVGSALESDCSGDSALESDCSVGSALESDCSVGSALESDCSVGSALESDCSGVNALESDKSVSRTENSNSEPSVSSHDQHNGNRTMEDELFKKKIDRLLERRTYMWRKALLNKKDGSKGRSVRTRKSPVARVDSPETVRCSVDSPETVRCSVDSPMGRVYSVRRVSPQKPQRSLTLGSPAASFASVASLLAPVNSAASDCSVDGILRSKVNASENIFTEVEMEALEKTSLKTFLLASRQRAAAAGSEAVHAFSQLAAYVRNFIKEYPEDLERISKDDLNNLNEKDSFTASLLPPSSLPMASPAASEAYVDSPLASVSSVASDCSEERFINFSSGNPQSSQPCSAPASVISMDSPLASVSSVASDCSEERFINFSSGNTQSSQPCSAPASVISMDSPLASVSSVASDCSEERFINFSSGNPQSSQPCSSLPMASPAASEAYVDSPLASVSSVASDCSEERFINFSSGNPQSSQPCSAPASVISMDSPLASVSSVASDCSEERFINFSSGNTQSSQPCRAAAGSDAPPVSLHDSGSSWLDTIEMTFTDDQLEKIVNYLQTNPNKTSLAASMGERVSLDDDLEDIVSIINDKSFNLNEKDFQTASPSLPRAAAGSGAPPVSIHDSGSSGLDTIEMTFTDDQLEKIVNYLQTSQNQISLTASMGERIPFDDDLEDTVGNLFEKHRSTIITLYNGAFDSSSAVFLIVKIDVPVHLVLQCAASAPYGLSFPPKTHPVPPARGLHLRVSERGRGAAPLPKHNHAPPTGQLFPALLLLITAVTQTRCDAEMSFRSCVLSWLFWWHLLWLSVMQLRHYLFIGTLNPMLSRLTEGDPEKISHYTNAFAFTQLCGVLCAPWNGLIMDRHKTAAHSQKDPQNGSARLADLRSSILSLSLTGFQCVLFSVCAAVPVLPLQYLTFILQVLNRSFLYGGNMAFIIIAFPPSHFGKLYGLLMSLSAVVSLLQYPCFTLVMGPLQGDPLYGPEDHRVTRDYQVLARATNIYQHLPRSTKGYQDLPTSTKGYQDLPTSTKGYQDLPRASKIYQGIPTSTKIYQHLPRPTKGYQDLPTSTNIYQDLPRDTKIYQDQPTSTKGYQDLPRFANIYQGIPRSTNIYQGVPRSIKGYQGPQTTGLETLSSGWFHTPLSVLVSIGKVCETSHVL
ncbi:UNVERIFIED_CONTAM: hypothetical protein FKN15_001173 [Acipenser sinensis]